MAVLFITACVMFTTTWKIILVCYTVMCIVSGVMTVQWHSRVGHSSLVATHEHPPLSVVHLAACSSEDPLRDWGAGWGISLRRQARWIPSACDVRIAYSYFRVLICFHIVHTAINHVMKAQGHVYTISAEFIVWWIYRGTQLYTNTSMEYNECNTDGVCKSGKCLCIQCT